MTEGARNQESVRIGISKSSLGNPPVDYPYLDHLPIIPQIHASAKPGLKETHDKVSEYVNFSLSENFLLWRNSDHLKSTID